MLPKVIENYLLPVGQWALLAQGNVTTAQNQLKCN
jgi:hypothetical protein